MFLKFKCRRTTNPLCPEYELPKYEAKPASPPKFIRDNMDTKDIDGSRPKQRTEKFLGDRMNVKDIHGTQSKKIGLKDRETLHDQIYADVSAKKVLARENPFNP